MSEVPLYAVLYINVTNPYINPLKEILRNAL